jgi:methylisocitrate lyase
MNGRRGVFVPRATRSDPGDALRRLLSTGETLAVPGVFNPAVGLLAKKAGFKAIYFSGAAFSNSLGLPDLGLTTLTEVANAVRMMTSMVRLPLIVDVDTGFGEALNVSRTVSEMERAGAAAIQIEDQVSPKRCGHLSGKQVVAPEAMVEKVVAAKRALATGMVLIARTDAFAIEGIDGAIDRAKTYLRAGADAIFPEALETRAEFVEFARKVKAPLVANMTEFGVTPYMTVDQFSEMGYRLVLFPVTTFRAAMKASQDALEELARVGSQRALLEKLMKRDAFNDLVDYRSYERADVSTAAKARRLNAG